MSLDKIFDRFKARFTKLFAKDLKRIDPAKFRDKEFQELYGFIGVDMPEESEDPLVVESTASSREQRWTLPFLRPGDKLTWMIVLKTRMNNQSRRPRLKRIHPGD